MDSSDSRTALAQNLRQAEALRLRREKQQGLGRPIVAAKLRHGQMVAVGTRVHLSPTWRTFHDFLRDHLFSLLGKEWLEAEQAKAPTERHRILQWFDQATEVARRAGTNSDGIYSTAMTGAIRAFVNLAYNIYLIAHHTENNGDAIVKGYIDRLKSTRSDDFAGALFETYAAAAFLKAGFTLEKRNFDHECKKTFATKSAISGLMHCSKNPNHSITSSARRRAILISKYTVTRGFRSLPGCASQLLGCRAASDQLFQRFALRGQNSHRRQIGA